MRKFVNRMKELRTWPDWSVASTTNQATEPLVKLALLHHQFKAIHPFHGGNGRTGRILNLLFLLQQRRLDIPVLYMLDAIETTSRATLEKVDAILALIADTVEKIRSARPALPARELAEVLFAQPSARIAFVEEHRIAKRQTASRYLQVLAQIGVLRPVRRGDVPISDRGRSVVYLR